MPKAVSDSEWAELTQIICDAQLENPAITAQALVLKTGRSKATITKAARKAGITLLGRTLTHERQERIEADLLITHNAALTARRLNEVQSTVYQIAKKANIDLDSSKPSQEKMDQITAAFQQDPQTSVQKLAEATQIKAATLYQYRRAALKK